MKIKNINGKTPPLIMTGFVCGRLQPKERITRRNPEVCLLGSSHQADAREFPICSSNSKWSNSRGRGPDRHPESHSWTLALLVAGLTIGCFNAWHWVAKEEKEMREEQEEKDD